MQAKLIMLVGLPASGKSTYAEQKRREDPVSTVIYSSDKMREELFKDQPYNPEDNQVVFNTLHSRITQDLKLGKTCIYDATNMSSKRRKAFLTQIKHIPCKRECVVLVEDINTCKDRDLNRKNSVGPEVIEKFWKRFEFPLKSEGWTSVIVKVPDYVYEGKTTYNNYLERAKGFSQKSKHHTLDLYNHMRMTKKYTYFYGLPILFKYGLRSYKYLLKAAMLHDIGKYYTQTAVDRKGETQYYSLNGEQFINYHYYGHESVSAYELMLCSEFWHKPNQDVSVKKYMKEVNKELDKLDEMKTVVTLVNYHMRLFSNKGSKSYEKEMRKTFSPVVYDMLQVLHKCDTKAH